MNGRTLLMALVPVVGLGVVSVANATNLQLTSFMAGEGALDGNLAFDCDHTSNGGHRDPIQAIAQALDSCGNPLAGTITHVTTMRSGPGSSQAAMISDDATAKCGGPRQHTGWLQYRAGTTWRNYANDAVFLSGCWNTDFNTFNCSGNDFVLTINSSQSATGSCAAHQYQGQSFGNTVTQ